MGYISQTICQKLMPISKRQSSNSDFFLYKSTEFQEIKERNDLGVVTR